MSEIYLYSLISVGVVSAISLIGVVTLSLQDRVLKKYLFLLVSLAIGALLGDAFIHLIPEAFEKLPTTTAGILVLAGILIFFTIEQIFHWHHAHGSEEECHQEIHPLGHMILISDGLHNLLDGIIIGASYLVSIEIGLATTLAVILHEIPQEISDFGVLIHAGYKKGSALLLNFCSALLAVLGVTIALIVGEMAGELVVWAIPFAAGSFIYIATADLIPELQKTKNMGQSLAQLAIVIVGVIAMALLLLVEA
jgi:zinc and cadmium transporter